MRKSNTRRLRLFVLSFAAVIVAWVLVDIYWPRRSSIRDFDPREVARLETAMWRSYYAQHRIQLFGQLANLLRTQYHMPFIRSNLVAWRAARAAVTFQSGKNRDEYRRALPDLVRFYSGIRHMSDSDFDVQRAAVLELEWWIVHRERLRRHPRDLERALAELQSELYHVPAHRLLEHAQWRAEAMLYRDAQAEKGRLTEADWRRIEAGLRRSWERLSDVVSSQLL
jgi:hypothetical protein